MINDHAYRFGDSLSVAAVSLSDTATFQSCHRVYRAKAPGLHDGVCTGVR